MSIPIRYLGGHIQHPLPFWGRVQFHENKLEVIKVEKNNPVMFEIPYQSIKNLENKIEEKTSIANMILFGIIGGFVLALLVGVLGFLVGLILGALIGMVKKEKTGILVITYMEGSLEQKRII